MGTTEFSVMYVGLMFITFCVAMWLVVFPGCCLGTGLMCAWFNSNLQYWDIIDAEEMYVE